MGFFISKINPVYVFRRKGDITDPYVSVSETLKINITGSVVLKEIPSKFDRVFVDGLFEVQSHLDIKLNEFYIDYTSGIAYFNNVNIGKNLLFTYMGTGVMSLGSSRVFVEDDGLAPTKSLQDVIEEANNTIVIIDTASEYATEQGDYAKNQGDSVFQAVTDANNATASISLVRDDAVLATNNANMATTNANIVISETNIVKNDTIKVKDDVVAIIGLTNTAKDGAILATTNANNKIIEANTAITQVNTAKSNAIIATTDAITAKNNAVLATTNANIATTDAITAKNNTILATTNTNIAKDETILATNNANNKIIEANDKITEVNTSIATANTAINNVNIVKSSAEQATVDAVIAKNETITVINNANNAISSMNEFQAKSDYSNSISYKKNNIVLYLGSSYVAIQDTVGNLPNVINSLYWKMLAMKGIDGEGSVNSVNNIIPDVNGNVNLGDIGAVKSVNGMVGVVEIASSDIVGLSDEIATTEIRAKAYTDLKVADIVASTPATLDTLNELANALGDDPNFAVTMTDLIGTKETPSGADAKVTAHQNILTIHTTSAEKAIWDAKAPNVVATVSVNGLMINTDKSKLDGIAVNANNYTHPSSHPASIITQDSSNRFMTDVEKTKLTGIATNANNYVHPATHPASIITQDVVNRFVTDAEKTDWNAKATKDIVTTATYGLMDSTHLVKLNGIDTGANNYVHPANHLPSVISQDANNRFVSDAEKATWSAKATTTVATASVSGLMANTDKSKLDGMAVNANNYVHPATHPASIIVEDVSKRFVTDAEKTNWNAKLDSSSYSASDVLNKVKTVDGSGSGLDADTLDGVQASQLAPISGVNGSWKVGKIVHNVANTLITATPTEILIKTGIPFTSGSHMPVIHIQGYAYGLQSPIELKLGYYIYNDLHGYCGAVSLGAWKPIIKLFSYLGAGGVKFTGVALIGSIYYPQFTVGVQTEMGGIYETGWSIENNSATNTVYNMPITDVVTVPYKSTFSQTINGVAFDGTSDITIADSTKLPSTANAVSASKLATTRNIALTGDGTGNVNFDGTANVTIPLVLKNSGVVAGTHGKVTVDSKGIVTSGTPLVASDIPSLDYSKITTGKPTTVAGYGLTDVSPTAKVSVTLPATIGWYRVATSISGIDRNAGRFEIDWALSGVHGQVNFNAGIMYGVDPTINQTMYSTFNPAMGITKTRIVYHVTYAGNFAYLEVYNASASAIALNVQLASAIGWSLIIPVTGSVPVGYSNTELTFKDGIVTDTQLVSQIATGIAPLAVNSTTVVANLNVDMLDGSHAGTGANNILKLDASGKASPNIITQDANNRFATDAEKANWNTAEQDAKNASFPFSGIRLEGTDLNTLVTAGHYSMGSGLINAPVGFAYAPLLVYTSATDRITQVAHSTGSGLSFIRHRTGVSTWSAWVEMETTTGSQAKATQAKIDAQNTSMNLLTVNVDSDPNTTAVGGILTSHANAPSGAGTYWYIQTYYYASISGTSNRGQIATVYHGTKSRFATRFHYNSVWTPWVEYSSTATTVPIADAGNKFASTNVEDALAELFTFANDGKTAVANAVTAKGVSASSTDAFPTLATKIGQIPKGQGNAVESKVLSGSTFSNADGVLRTGSMPNNTGTIITPGLTSKAIPVGYHYSSTVSGDVDLVPENILSGKNIFGVDGSVVAGKKFATGTASASGSKVYLNIGGTGYARAFIAVSGLSFTPRKIIAYYSQAGYEGKPAIMLDMDSPKYMNGADKLFQAFDYNSSFEHFKLDYAGYSPIRTGGFDIPATGGLSVTWWAYE